jgi:hypothetical protein
VPLIYSICFCYSIRNISTDDHFKVDLEVLFHFSTKKKILLNKKRLFYENKEIALKTIGNDKQSKRLFEQEKNIYSLSLFHIKIF